MLFAYFHIIIKISERNMLLFFTAFLEMKAIRTKILHPSIQTQKDPVIY